MQRRESNEHPLRQSASPDRVAPGVAAPAAARQAHPMLRLQRAIGNRAVQRLVQADVARYLRPQPDGIVQRQGGPHEAKPVEAETIPGPEGKTFRVVDRKALIRTGPPDFKSTGKKFERGTDVQIFRYDKSMRYAHLLERLPPDFVGPPQSLGWTSVSNLVEKHDVSGYKSTGTLSEVSWGETSGLYPAGAVEYDPGMWDAGLTRQLLAARCAITAVGERGESVHRAKPRAGDAIEQKLKVYHLTENFPPLDSEIADEAVKWFYLSKQATQNKHPGLSKASVRVKSYGPFYNAGGGDVKGGAGVYLHFFKV